MAAIKWASAKTGDWTTPADWVGGKVPGSGDDVTIDATGAYAVTISSSVAARSLTLNVAGGDVVDSGSLTIGSFLSLLAGQFELNASGIIHGGVLSARGGVFHWNGGALEGVTYDGVLDLSATNAALQVGVHGLTVDTASGLTFGSVNLTGASATLNFQNTQTFDDATINIGSASGSTISEFDTTGQGGALTLGANLVIKQQGARAAISSTGFTADSVVNKGSIYAMGAGGVFTVDPASFTNQGVLTATNGATLVLAPTIFTNLSAATLTGGAYSVDTGSILQLPVDAAVATDDAFIILAGSGSVIRSLNSASGQQVSLESTLTSISAAGTLELLNSRGWSSTRAMLNSGALILGGGTFAPASVVNSGTVQGYGAIATALTNVGLVDVFGGQTLSFGGGALTNLAGGVLTGGAYTIEQGGVLQLPDNQAIATLAATVILIGSKSAMQSFDSTAGRQVNLDSSLTAIAATGRLILGGGRAFASANAVVNSGTIQLIGGAFGARALTDTTGASLTGWGVVTSTFFDAGAIVSFGAALVFTGTGDTFAGPVTGTEIDFGGGTDLMTTGASLATLNVSLYGAAALTLAADQAVTGYWNQGKAAVNLAGFNLTLGGGAAFNSAVVTGAGTLTFAGGAQSLNAGDTIGAANWSLIRSASTSLHESLLYAGIFGEDTTSTIAIGAGDSLYLAGPAVISGAVGGAGALHVTGSAVAFDAGASLSAANVWLQGGTVAINGNLSYAGVFSDAGALLLGGGDTLALTGASLFGAGATVAGPGTLALTTATVSALLVGGSATLSDVGEVDQAGSITLGDTGANATAARLIVAGGATWRLDGDVDITRGRSKGSSVTVTGTLIKSAGLGTSLVGVLVTDAGLIEVASGTLAFTQGLTGKGTLRIDAGATLAASGAVARSLSVSFAGAGGVLTLGQPGGFVATIAGFATGESIDLVKTAATAVTLNALNQLIVVSGVTIVASLRLIGDFTGKGFTLTADGHGGSMIAVVPAASRASLFAQAMAGLGGGGADQTPIAPARHEAVPGLAIPGTW